MKNYRVKFLSLLLAVAMMLALAGCNTNDAPPSGGDPAPDYGILYETRSSIASETTYGFAEYGYAIPLTIRFNSQPGVLINIQESEYYEIIGQSEFNTNDYQPDEDGHVDINFTVKITKESGSVRAVNFRITCLCGEEDCGRFSDVSDGHYYDDTMNFAFIADSQGIILATNHSNIDGFNGYLLKIASDSREKG